MKIRFSKTLAAVLAATTLTAISGISAMAASVITTTDYTWGGGADTTVQVTSVVKAADKENAQVTYLVATANPSEEGAIKYIDQAPIKNGEATFTFTAKQSEIYDGATISAKFGSDDTTIAEAMEKFTFADGVDYYDNGNLAVTLETPVLDAVNNRTIIYGTLTGNASEYGVTINNTETFKAMATTYSENGGKFAIVIYGWQFDAATDTVAPYVK